MTTNRMTPSKPKHLSHWHYTFATSISSLNFQNVGSSAFLSFTGLITRKYRKFLLESKKQEALQMRKYINLEEYRRYTLLAVTMSCSNSTQVDERYSVSWEAPIPLNDHLCELEACGTWLFTTRNNVRDLVSDMHSIDLHWYRTTVVTA
jgi:hypothetical protein